MTEFYVGVTNGQPLLVALVRGKAQEAVAIFRFFQEVLKTI